MTTGIDPATPETAASHALEFAPDGILVVDTGGRIVYANQALHDLAAASESLIGHSVDDLVPDSIRRYHSRLRDGFSAAPSPRPMGNGRELMMRRLDGTELPVEIALGPYEDDGLHVIAAVRDVTERRENQQRLETANGQLALARERERIGRDLHDVILQRLYGTGLTVQAIAASTDQATSDRLDAIIDDVDRIIAEVRTIVFTLGAHGQQGTLGQELADIVAQSSRVLGFSPALRLEGPVESVLAPEVQTELLASIREALGNVARHSGARSVEVTIEVAGDQVVLAVRDDGVGPPAANTTVGNGLRNLQARAELFGGTSALEAAPRGGAVLVWSVPYRRPGEPATDQR